MFYAVYEPDGRIIQGIKVYDQPDYAKLLNEHGYKFVARNSPGLLSDQHWYVRDAELTERPLMPVEVSRTRIQAGGRDSAVLRGIPAGARFEITTSNITVHSGPLDGDELELFIPVPCIYRVRLDLWPFQTFGVDIEATI
jgi:hypothetical protein